MGPLSKVANVPWKYKVSDDVVKLEVWDVVDKGKKRQAAGLKLANDEVRRRSSVAWAKISAHLITSSFRVLLCVIAFPLHCAPSLCVDVRPTRGSVLLFRYQRWTQSFSTCTRAHTR